MLKKLSVEDRYLKFDGSVDVPTRFFVPTQAGTKFQAEQALGDWAEDSLRDGINKSNAGVKAMFDALNIVLKEHEHRNFLRLNAASLAFTVSGVVFVLLAVTAVMAVPVFLKHLGWSWLTSIIDIGRWPLLWAALAFVIACCASCSKRGASASGSSSG